MEAWLGIGAAGALVVYALVFAAMAVRSRPRDPEPGPPAMDLPDDAPPAVVGLITNAWGVPRAAAPATLLDLAARGLLEIQHLGPGEFTVRVLDGPARAERLAAYEERVLDLVRRLERHGEVPGDALTLGDPDGAKRWWDGFEREVVADARSRGLSRARWRARELTALFIASLAPAMLAAGAVVASPSHDGDPVEGFIGFAAFFVLVLLAPLAWLRAERDTPAGLAAAGRWLGLRRHLAADESFAEQPPAAVSVWERLLSYGTALGVARGVVRELPLGGESANEAWSPYGGQWHIVRVRYPRLLPPGWGRHPAMAVLIGLLATAASGLVAWVLFHIVALALDEVIADEVLPGGAQFGVAAGLSLMLAAVTAFALNSATLLVLGLSDLAARRTVTGRVVRMRPGPRRGNQQRRAVQTYVAVDQGTSAEVRAWLVDNDRCAHVSQGDEVSVVASPRLGWVESITGA